MTAGAGLDVRWNPRAHAWSLVIFAVAGVLYAVGWATGYLTPWVAAPGLVVFVGFFIWFAPKVRRLADAGPVLRLDTTGVTVPGAGTVPWSDLAEVRVTGMKPGWYFWLTRYVGRRLTTVVAFVGRDGVTVPALRFDGKPRFAWNRAVGRRLYGTECLVMPSTTTVPLEELLGAVRELSDVAVSDSRRGRAR